MDGDDLPIGRRMAKWRARRGLTQQMMADRLGKSKSWVDKVERGVRKLDRFPVIVEVADALRIDVSELVGGGRPAGSTGGVDGVDRVRAALACYDSLGVPAGRLVLPVAELGRRVAHARLTYEHADYLRLLRLLPDLLGDARRTAAGGGTVGLLVRVYDLTAAVLVKLGEADLGWLAADRAMAVAGGDRLLTASAAVPLGQALRAAGHGRLAMAVTIAAVLVEADRTAPAEVRLRPLARTLVVKVERDGPASAGIARLAALVGLTR